MKFNKYFLSIIALIFIFSFAVMAQEDKKMTKEEWEAEMARLNTQKTSLTQEISTLNTDITNLKSQNIQSYDDCMNELYTMIGASKSDIDNYRTAVNELSGKIERKEGPKADRQKDLNALKMNKISALPEFFDKVQNQMQKDLDSWVEEPTVKNYEVVKGDCLWRIAKKPEFYGNGFAWPVIYKANRDEIKNPDLIFPKQNFKIPNLTEDEKAKYEKLKMNYKPAPVQ
ncbi:MAG: LysM peptidoglycan-binding domain-containing protein [Ignavibacteriaceae bacterium]|nr:LysM peptidoglycan-binding domain-containing protein [Ignavibacteriaceae bacterium]